MRLPFWKTDKKEPKSTKRSWHAQPKSSSAPLIRLGSTAVHILAFRVSPTRKFMRRVSPKKQRGSRPFLGLQILVCEQGFLGVPIFFLSLAQGKV